MAAHFDGRGLRESSQGYPEAGYSDGIPMIVLSSVAFRVCLREGLSTDMRHIVAERAVT